MFQSSLFYRTTIRAPAQEVFDALADHESMSDWPGLDRVTLVREGSPRNGLGAIRRVHVMGLTLDEAIVRWDPPRGFDYQIIKGLPVRHLGTVELRPDGDGTELTWRIRLRSPVPFLAALVLARLRAGLPVALEFVARRLESAASDGKAVTGRSSSIA
ncbi:MAG: SRPBCC family protein [Myxococcales bacterium]|nr:SRPBCC family protein [Myxococcales bacterium]